MLLGKRPRHPMKKTTSMSEIISLDPNTSSSSTDVVVVEHEPKHTPQVCAGVIVGLNNNNINNGLLLLDHNSSSRVTTVGATDYSPRLQRRHSANSDFLNACSLCKRRLLPGCDIYMYRGDSGFCSLECRQQQMKQDERKEKLSIASKKQQVVVTPLPSGSSQSQVTTKTGTVAAT